jgi:LDH2 family malate/lactate/ureidoglycolate dehydrogenase
MAMSQAAVGKVGTYKREGRKVPGNWGLDSSGKPTDDPAAIMASRRFLPFGDHKGAALGFMMELLTGVLAGGLVSFEIQREDSSGYDTHGSKLFIALDVAAFCGQERYAQRIDDLLGYIHEAEPGIAITGPGERGWETRDRYRVEGIPIHPEIEADLLSIGVRLI